MFVDFAQSLLLDVVDLSFDVVDAWELVNGFALLLLHHLQHSSNVHLTLDIFVDFGDFVEFGVDYAGCLGGEPSKSSISLSFDFAKLVPDNVLALLCNHEFDKGITVLIVELLEDVTCAALSHDLSKDMLNILSIKHDSL